MKPAIRWSILLLSLLLATACSPVHAPAATPPAAQSSTDGATDGTTNGATAGAPADVVAAIAQELGVQPAELTVVSAEAVEWNDACLGVVQMDQMCAQVITPGYRIVVEVGGDRYTYHTDRSGSSLRQAPNEQAQTDKGSAILGLGRLTYAGPEELGSNDASRCAQMQMIANGARLVTCDGVETILPLPENLAFTWRELSERLASFTYETPSEQLTFQGEGEIAGPEWQHAALAWARTTRAELASGQTSATARTALSWNLGLLADTPGICAHLTVLDYAYAYAEQRACEGGDLVSSAEGWLAQAEIEQFDRWLYEYAPLYVDDNYVNGVGKTDMAEDGAATVAAWAQTVWERLGGLPLAPADPSAADPSA